MTVVTDKLAAVRGELEGVKATMTDMGQRMTDTSPMQAIEKAAKQLKQETQELGVRIGVVSNSLLREQRKQRHDSADNGGSGGGDDDDNGFEDADLDEEDSFEI